MKRNDLDPRPVHNGKTPWFIAGGALVIAVAVSGYVWSGTRGGGAPAPGAKQQAANQSGPLEMTATARPDTAPLPTAAGGGAMFSDVAAARGMNHVMASWGLSWNDFNADGAPDLFVADHMHFPSTLYGNHMGLWFERTGELGHQVGLDDHQVAFGDIDSDGLEDAFVAPGFYRPPKLLMNKGDGVFEETSDGSGTQVSRGSGRSSLFVDFNGDGCLDLAVFNNQGGDDFYTGNCDGTFENVSISSRMPNELNKLGGTAGDLDGDGDLDFVTFTNMGIFLFFNRGDGTFVDLSERIEIDFEYHPGAMVGGALGDYDNDGDLDLYLPFGTPNDMLYRNRGDGTFENVAQETGISVSSHGPRSAVFADFNNDTWLDLYVVDSGRPHGDMPSDLFLNQGDGSFLEVSEISGAQAQMPGVPISSAIGDYNLDGLPDILLGNGDGEFQISGHVSLLENLGAFGGVEGETCGNWLWVNTSRQVGNTDDQSAVVRVRLPDGRTLVRHAATRFRPQAQDAPGVHVGIGCAAQVDEITVTWPDNHVWRMQNVPANQRVLAVAGQSSWVRSHPAALLSEAYAMAPSVETGDVGRSPDPEATVFRENEVLARALVSRLAGRIRIGDAEVKAFIDEQGDKLGTEPRIQMERLLIGPFTPRRKQPRLKWDVANEAKTRFLETNASANDIAVALNIRAWGITDPAIGRFWNIPGETRGYAENGNFTQADLERRFGPEMAARIFKAPVGRVFGPIRQPELDEVFLEDAERFPPDTLNLVKVVGRVARAEPSIATDGLRIKRALERRQLQALIDEEVQALEGADASDRFDWAYYGAVRYPVSALADRARAQGLADLPEVSRALALARAEAQRNDLVDTGLTQIRPSQDEITAFAQDRPELTRDEPLLLVERMFFFTQEDADKALQLIAEGKSFTEVQAEMEIPSLATRESRGASTYFAETILWENLAEVQLGQHAWDAMNVLDVGETTGVIKTKLGRQIFLVKSRTTTLEGAAEAITSSAPGQVRLQKQLEALASGLADAG